MLLIAKTKTSIARSPAKARASYAVKDMVCRYIEMWSQLLSPLLVGEPLPDPVIIM